MGITQNIPKPRRPFLAGFWLIIAIPIFAFIVLGACARAESEQASPTETPVETQTPEEGTSVQYKDLTVRPQIWFGPLDPWSWEQHLPGQGPFQYYDLFSENAEWQEVSEAVQIIRLYPVWLESYASPSQLRVVLEDIQRRGIAISYEAGPLTERGQCNAATIEGFWGVPAAQGIVKRIANAGAVLYSMDLEHGFDAATYYDPACRMTPTEIAQDAARTIRAVREVFPDARIGSIETADLDVDAVAAWMSAYREVMGEEMAYFHLDINYSKPDWAERAKEIETYVKSRGVEFGIFYFGDAHDSTDAEWLARTEERFVEYEAIAGGDPDHVIFQSWHPHPQRLFPETEPGTFTNLILRYMRLRPSLTMKMTDLTADGSLMDSDGNPIPGAPIQIKVQPRSGEGVFAEYTITGNVPEDAMIADAGFRINMECECNGQASFILDQVEYLESGRTTNQVPNGRFSNGLTAWGIWGNGAARLVTSPNDLGAALSVSVDTGQSLGMNSGAIPVTPGSAFTVTFTARIDPISAGSGYFNIIFLNAAGEVRRLTTPLKAGQVVLAEFATDQNGKYSVDLENLPAGELEISAWYAGDDNFWPALESAVVNR